MKFLSLIFLLILCASFAQSGTPTVTVDTISYGANMRFIWFASLHKALSTTADTVVLPGKFRYLEVMPIGASSDTIQISFPGIRRSSTGANVKGVAGYSLWVRGDKGATYDFGIAVTDTLYVKAKSSTPGLFLNVRSY